MMRTIFSASVLLLALILTNCGSNKVIYTMAEERFVFDRDSLPYGKQKILAESSASFLTYEFNEGKDPLKVYVRFHGIMPAINTIEDVTLQLSYKNDRGETVTFLPDDLKEFKVEYSNGRSIVSLPIKNKNISGQVNWKEADWGEYTQNSSVDFSGTFIFKQKEFPVNMIMKFEMTWKDSQKQFETTLTKGDYSSPKINPKF